MKYQEIQKSYNALAAIIQNRANSINDDTDIGEFSDDLNQHIELLLDEIVLGVMAVQELE